MMFSRLVPPFCLLLALAMLVVGFSLIAGDGPDESVQLHQARARGDELYVDALEADLRRKQLQRYTLIASLLFGSGLMIFTAFRSMRGTSR